MIDRVNAGEPIILSDSSSSSGSEDNVLKKDELDITEHGVTSMPKQLNPINEDEEEVVIDNL
jgi:hypothetical protein